MHIKFHISVVVVVDPLLPDYWGESASVVLWGFPPASPASHLAGLLRRRDPSTNPGPIAWWDLWATEEMLCGMFVSATKGAEW